MNKKVIQCGECKYFKYEDIDGWGYCYKTSFNTKVYCGEYCRYEIHKLKIKK